MSLTDGFCRCWVAHVFSGSVHVYYSLRVRRSHIYLRVCACVRLRTNALRIKLISMDTYTAVCVCVSHIFSKNHGDRSLGLLSLPDTSPLALRVTVRACPSCSTALLRDRREPTRRCRSSTRKRSLRGFGLMQINAAKYAPTFSVTFGPVRETAPDTDCRTTAERKRRAGRLVRSSIFD